MWVSRAIGDQLRSAGEASDVGQFQTVVDVGGGNGALMGERLHGRPRPTGIAFGLPRLAESARATIDTAGLSARCAFQEGHALDAVPVGGGAYARSSFVINWPDDEAVVPWRYCRASILPHGTLVLVQWTMPSGDEPKEGLRFWDTVAHGPRHADRIREWRRSREDESRARAASTGSGLRARGGGAHPFVDVRDGGRARLRGEQGHTMAHGNAP